MTRRTAAVILLLVPFLAVLLTPGIHAQTPVEGLWDDRFGLEEFGGRGLPGSVNAIARHPVTGDIYAAGEFVYVLGMDEADYIARWDGETWHALGGGLTGHAFDIGFDSSGNLYVAGRFLQARQSDGSQLDVAHVAMWDGSTWHSLGRGVNGRALELAVDPLTDDVYVGGDWNGGFDEGINADSSLVVSPKIIRWDGSEWQPVGKGLRPGFGSGVFALAVDPANGDVYAGGSLFGKVFNPDSSEVESHGLARWDGSTWTPLRQNGDNGFVDVLEFDPSGRLWAGGDFTQMEGLDANGIAYRENGMWRADVGGRTDGTVKSIAFMDGDIYVGGSFSEMIQPDGVLADGERIARWDGSRWQPLASGVWSRHFGEVRAMLVEGTDVFVGGRFTQAGGLPANYFSIWHAEAPDWPAAYATFRVDTRRQQRYHVYENASMPLVNIFTGDRPGRYMLHDPDGDSVWTARVAQPVGVPLRYLYGVDLNGDGYDADGYGVDSDWLLELDGSESGARSVTLSSSAPAEVGVSVFDNLPDIPYPADFDNYNNIPANPGNPDRLRMNLYPGPVEVNVDFESLDRTAQVSVRNYLRSPGGALPAGIVVVGEDVYFGIEASPNQADYSARLTIFYERITGIELPPDLRILYRSTPSSAWQVRTTELDVVDQTLSVANVTELTGEWVIGSVSAANPLTADPPAVASVPSPTDGALSVPITPTLSWSPSRHASSYEVYLWRAGEAEPSEPLTGGGSGPSYSVKPAAALTAGQMYNWRVVAGNPNGETAGPIWSFTAGQASDLVVTDVQPPAEAVAGNQISVTWTVENVGTAGTRAPGWMDAVFFSEDDSLDTSEDILVAESQNGSYLGAGDSYFQTAEFELPQRVRGLNEEIVVEGSYTVFVVADYRRQAPSGRELETDESNNSAPSILQSVVEQPVLPDVRTTALLDPETHCPQLICASGLGCTVIYVQCELPNPFSWALVTGLFGIRYVFSWEGINEGVAPTRDGFTSLLFLQKDSLFNAEEAIPVGVGITGVVDAGESYEMTTGQLRQINLSASATLAGKALPDSGYFFVQTDLNNSVYEGTNDDDNLYRNPERAVFRPVPPSDLEAISMAGPASAVSGDSLNISWSIRNNGPSYVIPTYWHEAIYLSEDDEFDPGADRLLVRFPYWSSVDSPMSADAVLDRSERVRIPDGVSGSFRLFVFVDDEDRVNEVVNNRANRENNIAGSGALEISLANYPDLLVESVTVPDAVVAGENVNISWEVHNDGAGSTERQPDWRERIYISSSNSTLEDARLLKSIEVKGSALEVGESRHRTASVRISRSFVGTGYVWVVTDADSTVYELDGERNNNGVSGPVQISKSPAADLIVEAITVPPAGMSGDDMTVTWTVRNQGDRQTSATSWIDRVYLSTDADLNEDDVLLGEALHTGALGVGGSYQGTLTAPLPTDFSGDRFVIIQSDGPGSVIESNRLNNTRESDSAVAVSLAAPADFVLQDMELAVPSPRAGQPVSVILTVMNQGVDIPADVEWTDVVTLSSSSSGPVDAQAVVRASGPLPSGATYESTLELTIPVYASGSFYLNGHVNDGRDVGEGGEYDNNDVSEIIDIVLPPPVDLMVQNIDVPASASPGSEYVVTYDLVNTGTNPAEGVLYDAVYLSSDDRFDAGDIRLDTRRREVDLQPGSAARMSMTIRMPEIGEGVPAAKSGPTGSSIPGGSTAADTVANYLPGLMPGTYRVFVWTDVRNNIRETDNENNRALAPQSSTIDVAELQFDQPYSDAVGTGKRRYYRIESTAGRDLRFTLDHIAGDARPGGYEVYVAFDRPPTLDDFDAAYLAESMLGSPTVLVPATQAGSYVVMVRQPFLPEEETASFDLLVESFSFTVLDITPDAGGRSGRVIATVSGAQFDDGTTYRLERDGRRIDGQVIQRISSMETAVRFDLRGHPLGRYDIVATKNGSTARLDDAFEVEISTASGPNYTISSPPTLWANGPATFEIVVENVDNYDYDYVLLTVIVPSEMSFSLRSQSFLGAPIPSEELPSAVGSNAAVPIDISVPDLDFYSSGWIAMNLIARDVRIGETITARLDIKNVIAEIGDPLPIVVGAQEYDEAGLAEEFVGSMRAFADVLRSQDLSGLEAQRRDLIHEALRMLNSSDPVELVNRYMDETGLRGAGPLAEERLLLTYDAPPGGIGKSGSALLANAMFMSSDYHDSCYYVGAVSHVGSVVTTGLLINQLLFGTGAALSGYFVTLLGGILTVSTPIGWVIAAVAVAAIAWSIYKVSQSERTVPMVLCDIVTGSRDPNDIVGPRGRGDARWVKRDEQLRYRIRFENDPERANAPAREVIVRQTLDEDLDLRTFRVEEIGFGNFKVEVPEGRAYYQTRIDARDSLGVFVDFSSSLDVTTNEIVFRFASIDPSTGELSQDPELGFLPPNLTPPEGDGYIQYRVQALPDAPTGNRIDAEASIFFDLNAPIDTPSIFNTIDGDAPVTGILPASVRLLDDRHVELSWTGRRSDVGSGTQSFTLYAAPQDSAFEAIETGLSDTTFVFRGEPGVRYGFFVAGRDLVGNVEPLKGEAEVNVLVGTEDSDPTIPNEFALDQNYPNPFNPSTTIPFRLAESGEVEITVYDVIGRRVLRYDRGNLAPGRYQQLVDMSRFASGIYFYQLRVTGENSIRFRDVGKFVLVK